MSAILFKVPIHCKATKNSIALNHGNVPFVICALNDQSCRCAIKQHTYVPFVGRPEIEPFVKVL